MTQPNLIALAIGALIVLPLLYFRMRKTMVARPLRMKSLWIRPLVFVALAAIAIASAPPPLLDWLWLALAAALGAGLGWQRGKSMAIHVHPENGTLMTRGSQAAVVILVVLVVARLGLRTGLQMEASALHLSPAFIADIFVVFAAALFGVQTLEMFLRARRVFADSKSAGGRHATPLSAKSGKRR